MIGSVTLAARIGRRSVHAKPPVVRKNYNPAFLVAWRPEKCGGPILDKKDPFLR